MNRLQKYVKNNWFWYSLLIVILSAVFARMLLIVPLFIGVVILFAKSATSQSSNDSEISIGERGGRYEMRISEKTGKPYRHYF
tara:strand:- start:342 stop:590 length:249 start_codon:yes stop_codon:yes gene_type:complete